MSGLFSESIVALCRHRRVEPAPLATGAETGSVVGSKAMASAIRTIGHEDRLSLVDHLEELRTRLIVSGAVLAVAFGICLWQNHALLRVINQPLKAETQKQVVKGEGTVGQAVLAQRGLLNVAG